MINQLTTTRLTLHNMHYMPMAMYKVCRPVQAGLRPSLLPANCMPAQQDAYLLCLVGMLAAYAVELGHL